LKRDNLSRRKKSFSPGQAAVSFCLKMNSRLARIKNWEGFARECDFDPARMAALCPISLRQLERYFVKKFRQTPEEWCLELKCTMAARLITQGYSNKAVVSELKFASQSHFCHAFKKIYGVPPQAFAPLHKSEIKMSFKGNNVV
jgi:AraC-like DNA-binding protein